ncbi:MAG: helix-turn-helix domain-containing protein [Chloroflexota bacterium]|nr:helix-turn-helix domain-containing protein [Chloroflexota bacterium]
MTTAKTRRTFPKGTPLLTDQQAAERAACSVSTIRRLRRAGVLPTTRLGAAVRIPESALDAYLDACTQ